MNELTDTRNISIKDKKRAGYLLPGALAFALALCLPIFTLVVMSAQGNLQSFLHIATTVMPSSGMTTILLMAGVGLFVATVGTVCAWFTTYFEFPLRKILQWSLVLPLAVPTYISAYTFVEFFSYTGPLQEFVRLLGGFTSSREYWFPEIRSLGGTVFVLGFVLYPYVYLSVRALFLLQGSNIPDSARVLGSSGPRLFFSITLPLARPAIALGVTLALMETINDIGAVEYLGTHTLTFSVFSVWLNQNDLAGAAQLAIFLLFIVAFLIFAEHVFRGSRRFHELRGSSQKTVVRKQLSGKQAVLVTGLLCLPVIAGFGIPMAILSGFALGDIALIFSPAITEAFVTTCLLGLAAAFLSVMGGFLLSYALRVNPTPGAKFMVRLATTGYAIPGTLVALGVFIPLAAFDNSLDAVLREYAGISSGLLITGSGAALIFAYIVRFMAMAEGNLENGFSKISPNLDMAARNLGRNDWQVFRTILLPLMRPAIAGASLLVFVDVVKELSATILLRPFGMNTLATHVYDYASQGRVEDGALACVLIILVGVLPVVFLVQNRN
ncbi:MAG: iron ABC transporter permease [Rhizobiaceae bacterium]|nr:iron ABC transporter permease [Rhizobiaceae bacterium]